MSMNVILYYLGEYLIYYYIYLLICMYICMCAVTRVEVRGQLARVGTHLPLMVLGIEPRLLCLAAITFTRYAPH